MSCEHSQCAEILEAGRALLAELSRGLNWQAPPPTDGPARDLMLACRALQAAHGGYKNEDTLYRGPYCVHGINHSGERHGCDGCCKKSGDVK